jgi:hypothetical protein
LDERLVSPYLTSGTITDAGNRFNGFRLRGSNATLSCQTRVLYIDNIVTSALTVPSGFSSFAVSWTSPLARLHWTVNSEISINRYVIERSANGVFVQVGSMKGSGNVDSTLEYEYVDTPPAGSAVQYRVRQMTNDGGQEVSTTITVNTVTNSVGPEGPSPKKSN